MLPRGGTEPLVNHQREGCHVVALDALHRPTPRQGGGPWSNPVPKEQKGGKPTTAGASPDPQWLVTWAVEVGEGQHPVVPDEPAIVFAGEVVEQVARLAVAGLRSQRRS